MIAERESMTLQEIAPALGVEERRDGAPRAGASHARPTPDPEVGQAEEAQVHRAVSTFWRRQRAPQVRWAGCFAARGCTAPIGMRRARREGSLQFKG